MFRKTSFFNGLSLAVLAALVIAGEFWLRSNRPPLDLAAGRAAVTWVPVSLAPLGDPRARLAGAWELRSAEPRIGGLSGLAVDGGRLLALSDGGMLVWLPRPGQQADSEIRPLPAVAGNPHRKIGRDSEALLRVPDGRGWWVAFEQRHQLILYDGSFRRMLASVPITGQGFRRNRGIEALSGGDPLTWHAESSGASDAAPLPGGGMVLLKRSFGPGGFRASIAGIGSKPLRLPTGRLDNVEGLAAEPLANGRIRLWVISDNDFSRWRRTLLLAVDLP